MSARGAGSVTEPNSTFAGPSGALFASFGAAGGGIAAASTDLLVGLTPNESQGLRGGRQSVTQAAPEIAIVIPTLNERANISVLDRE